MEIKEIMIGVFVIVLYGIILYGINKICKSISNNTNNSIVPDKKITEMYLNELIRMIATESIYTIDVKFGDLFRDKKSMTYEIDNTEIHKAIIHVCTRISDMMSKHMKEYLYFTLGKDWLFEYIKINVSNTIIDYTTNQIKKIKSIS